MADVLAMADPECRELWNTLSLGYPFHVQGHPLLVGEIGAQHSQPVHVNVLAPQEGIFIAAHALLQAGDRVIVTTPGYQSLWEVPETLLLLCTSLCASLSRIVSLFLALQL